MARKKKAAVVPFDLILRYVRLRETLDSSKKPRRPNRPPLPPVLDPLTGLVPLMTLKQVANHLNQSTRTVTRLLETRKLDGYKSGGDWRVKLADLIRYLEKRLRRAN